MNFSTSEFLFIFLPFSIILFYTVPPFLRLAVMTASSLFFYGMSGDLALALLVTTISVSALSAFIVKRWSAKWILYGAIAVPLGFLFLFKYLGFSLDVLGTGPEVRGQLNFILRYVLPAGISFYTFQVVSYLIDVHDGVVMPEKNPIKLAAFISFFPQLIAGPILRFDQISPQLDRISRVRKLRPALKNAIKYLSYGLAYKILFADVLRSLHEQHQLASSGALDVIFAIFSYSLIIYYDFWAYSLMAMGLAKLFCIDLPRNFREPYMSTSPKDFWRRWHVTLSYWLRDYLYFRLGGNVAYLRNMAIVFIACGIWHGAGWNFLIWGAYHAGLVILYHLTRDFWDQRHQLFKITATFILVSLGWPLFYLDFEGFLTMMTILFSLTKGDGALQYGTFGWGYLSLVAIWTFAFREDRWLFNDKNHAISDNPVVIGILFSISVVFLYFSRTFIYFNF